MKFYVLLIACAIAWGVMELGAEAPLPPGWKWTSTRSDTANCKTFQGGAPDVVIAARGIATLHVKRARLCGGAL